jgi:gas vesicle protein
MVIMKTSLIFILGVGMGVVLGILVAPESGRVTRRKIREEADRIVDQALAKKQLNALTAETKLTTAALTNKKNLTLS